MNYTAAVITVSDKGARGERVDTSGPALCALLAADGFEVVFHTIVPDEREEIEKVLRCCADEQGIPLVLTTGGTGFSPRDVTPEATKAVIERETPGLPEVMRSESMKATPHGCLSRGVAGIRGRTLIVNLPGSERAARESYLAIQNALGHGVKMLLSQGSAECASTPPKAEKAPSLDAWLREAKAEPTANLCGMYLFHNGVVRETAKAQVRQGQETQAVTGMDFSYDEKKTEEAIAAAKALPGIFHVRVWLNRGRLSVGDDLMLVLVGGDTRPHVIEALQTLVQTLKTHCVLEQERF